MAPREPLTVDQGTSWRAHFTYIDSSNDPVDLTGWTAAMDVRRSYRAEEPLIELSTENGRITLGDPDPVDGVVLLTIEHEATEELPPGTFLYDIELTSPGGFVYRFLEGKIKVRPEVTRDDE